MVYKLEFNRQEVILLHHCLRAWNANTYDNLADINDALIASPDNQWLNEFHDWLVQEHDLGVDLELYLARFINE